MKKIYYAPLALLFFINTITSTPLRRLFCTNSPKRLYSNYLYAPWRTQYSRGTKYTKDKKVANKTSCPFCDQFAQHNDPEHYILGRFKHSVAMLNRYPYNAGHLLILPKTHFADLNQICPEGRQELMELVTASVSCVKETLGASAVNVGINLGRNAGASLGQHLHVHVLPRYEGDTSFLDTLDETHLLSVALRTIYERLKPEFDDIDIH